MENDQLPVELWQEIVHNTINYREVSALLCVSKNVKKEVEKYLKNGKKLKEGDKTFTVLKNGIIHGPCFFVETDEYGYKYYTTGTHFWNCFHGKFYYEKSNNSDPKYCVKSIIYWNKGYVNGTGYFSHSSGIIYEIYFGKVNYNRKRVNVVNKLIVVDNKKVKILCSIDDYRYDRIINLVNNWCF